MFVVLLFVCLCWIVLSVCLRWFGLGCGVCFIAVAAVVMFGNYVVNEFVVIAGCCLRYASLGVDVRLVILFWVCYYICGLFDIVGMFYFGIVITRTFACFVWFGFVGFITSCGWVLLVIVLVA